MNKEEFLGNLEIELEKIKYDNSEEIIEYYYELIEDKKENGLKEKDIISSLPKIEEIVKGLDIENKIEIAYNKPTLSNGIKALIATTSLLSLPILVPLMIVLFALIFSLIMIIFAIIITIGALFISSIAGIIGMFVNLFTGTLPIETVFFSVGILLIILILSGQGFKTMWQVSKDIILYFVNKLKRRFEKERGKENE